MSGLPDSLRCLFTARLDRRGDSYVLEVPAQEVENGTLTPDERLRVAVHSGPDDVEPPRTDAEAGRRPESGRQRSGSQRPRQGASDTPQSDRPDPTPDAPEAPTLPVEEGEHRVVTIESLGEQGDGIATVEGGYVLIVPETDPDDEVEVEVTMVTPTVAFAEVVEER